MEYFLDLLLMGSVIIIFVVGSVMIQLRINKASPVTDDSIDCTCDMGCAVSWSNDIGTCAICGKRVNDH